MSFSNYLEDKLLRHVFAGSAYTAPSTLYVALFTAAPSDTGGGTEVSGGGYARQSAAFSVSGTSPTVATNTANIDYPTATADYGAVTHIGVFDAATSGNLLAYAAATTSKNISTGDVLRIPSGDLDIQLD